MSIGYLNLGRLEIHATKPPRIYLSSPHLGTEEFDFVREAFATNWIAPLGPHVDRFEREFAELVGSPHAAALSSGTAALHLALKVIGLLPGDEVFCSTLTFSASVNPIVYEHARPVLIDSERTSWNMDPARLAEALEDRARRGRLPRAVILVHLYGQSADIDPIAALCARYGVTLIEDAAEALGAIYWSSQPPSARSGFASTLAADTTARPPEHRYPIVPGTRGRLGIYSFNGNKIITTSGGGMLVAAEEELVAKARFLATQARDPAPHYQHSEIGYNYRLSNVLAGIGRGQLRVLRERVEARRANWRRYVEQLGDLAGIQFMPEAPWGRSSRWLTCVVIDPARYGASREDVRSALEVENIEARPVWKPMHLQPVFSACDRFGGDVAEDLFHRGLCLPSGSNLSRGEVDRVAAIIRGCQRGAACQ